jgi:hypothetical protein
MKLTLLAKSSSGQPYDVTFETQGGRMIVHCTCKAGEFYQQCKHKRALTSGDAQMLFEKSQSPLLTELLATPEASELAERLLVEENALAIVEREKARLAAQEKAIKNRIAGLFIGKS